MDWQAFSPDALKAQQRERFRERKFVKVPEWGMAVPIRRITFGNLIEATSLATGYDPETGKTGLNEGKKNIFLILFSVEGMEMKHREMLQNEPAGVINNLLAKILEYSGFHDDMELIESFDEEKKT